MDSNFCLGLLHPAGRVDPEESYDLQESSLRVSCTLTSVALKLDI